jgi:hypothetical protein
VQRELRAGRGSREQKERGDEQRASALAEQRDFNGRAPRSD